MLRKWLSDNIALIYPLLAGLFAFLATVCGSYFFRADNHLVSIMLGALMYLGLNHLLYKLKFNSYKELGSTVTTVLVFVSQIMFMMFWKMEQIGVKWVLGVVLVFVGTLILHADNMAAQNAGDVQKK